MLWCSVREFAAFHGCEYWSEKGCHLCVHVCVCVCVCVCMCMCVCADHTTLYVDACEWFNGGQKAHGSILLSISMHSYTQYVTWMSYERCDYSSPSSTGVHNGRLWALP